MKLIKLSVFMTAFLAFTQVAMATGPMEKAEIRGGQLICEGNGSGPKVGISPVSDHSEDRRGEGSKKSAL